MKFKIRKLSMKVKVLLVTSIVMIALVILNIVISSTTKSIRLINRKLYELVHTQGDLTQTLMINSGNEMEMLANNVNELLNYICKIMLGISANSGQLNDSTKVVVDDLFHADKNVVDVSTTMEQMGVAMEETATALSQISDSVSEIYQGIDSIAKKTQEGNHTFDGKNSGHCFPDGFTCSECKY